VRERKREGSCKEKYTEEKEEGRKGKERERH
jgi:hypothetical protein